MSGPLMLQFVTPAQLAELFQQNGAEIAAVYSEQGARLRAQPDDELSFNAGAMQARAAWALTEYIALRDECSRRNAIEERRRQIARLRDEIAQLEREEAGA